MTIMMMHTMLIYATYMPYIYALSIQDHRVVNEVFTVSCKITTLDFD
jgi:hypothetical protein